MTTTPQTSAAPKCPKCTGLPIGASLVGGERNTLLKDFACEDCGHVWHPDAAEAMHSAHEPRFTAHFPSGHICDADGRHFATVRREGYDNREEIGRIIAAALTTHFYGR
jgi:hypothetical protein